MNWVHLVAGQFHQRNHIAQLLCEENIHNMIFSAHALELNE